MAKQTFTTGQVLTAAQMISLQETAMGGGPATAKTASYVLVAADAGTTVAMNAAGATTITVNTGLFAAGDTVFIQNLGAGACTVTAGTATVATAGSLILPQNDAGILYFTATGAAIFYDYIQAGAVSPLTTKGDLYTFSTSDARLAVGADGTTLVADSGATTGLKYVSNPTFRAYRTGNQSMTSGTFVKIQLNNESFDTDSAFDPTTNYRFTPNVPGYYQINSTVNTSGSAAYYNAHFKNGSELARVTGTIPAGQASSGSNIVYLNGTTDYIELYVFATGAGLSVSGASESDGTFMSGHWIRS